MSQRVNDNSESEITFEKPSFSIVGGGWFNGGWFNGGWFNGGWFNGGWFNVMPSNNGKISIDSETASLNKEKIKRLVSETGTVRVAVSA